MGCGNITVQKWTEDSIRIESLTLHTRRAEARLGACTLPGVVICLSGVHIANQRNEAVRVCPMSRPAGPRLDPGPDAKPQVCELPVL